jgi:hypothetical protein
VCQWLYVSEIELLQTIHQGDHLLQVTGSLDAVGIRESQPTEPFEVQN